MTHTLTPVQSKDRLHVVDVLRGFALLGILLVNMELFTHPVQQLVLPLDPATPAVDQAAFWLVRFLAEGKFYSLFSFLFGLGLFLQMTRVEERGGNFAPLYARRLLVLLGFGLAHAFLIWVGDILVTYALFGFLLLLFRKARPRTLLIWIGFLVGVPILLNLGLTGLVTLGRSTPQGAAEIEAQLAAQTASYQLQAETALQVYAHGGFAEITAQRASDLLLVGLGGLYALGPGILTMFLFGVYFGKRGWLHDLEASAPFFRRLLWWGLAVGVSGSLLYASLSLALPRIMPSFPLFLAQLGQTLGAPALTFAYISGLALLWLQPAWRERLKVLAPVGQMALTNYLTQSIVCTTLFYGYGFGYFGRLGTASGLVLAIVIYAVQIVVSNWWMRRFHYGPAEWLWRSLTYGRLQPMRRNAQAATQANVSAS